MYIVGTSGHIDHGKTSLIKALTGIDCDRLPEEKKREMTIDIGFSQIEYPKFGTVSIIDVPGHERFIRNMVVGAWGIDLALLVVAVDDSWMPQTEDHFRVLDLLGIERIIVVLNKIDIADEEIIEIVTDDVRDRLKNTKFENSDIVRVSSKTGLGIDDLKAKIQKNLSKLSKIPDTNKPYLYIDRVFASKGHGTIITGTLKNGKFNEDELVTILPLKKEARIKKIENHYSSITEGSPSQRTALNLSGVSVDELKRGYIIVKQNFYTESKEILAKIKLLEKNKDIKNNLGVEILIGTSSQKGKLILLSAKDSIDNELIIRIKFENNWHFYSGEPFIITNPGGYRIIGGGAVILPDFKRIKNKQILKKNLTLLEKYSVAEIIEFIIKVNFALKKEDVIKQLLYNSKSIEKAISTLIEKKSILELDNYLIGKKYYNNAKEKIIEIINNNVGLNQKEISDLADVEMDVCKILVLDIQNDSQIVEKDGKYFSGSSITIDTLSDKKKKILLQINDNGKVGIELEKLKDDAAKKHIKELISLGFAISLDGNIVYHINIYNDLKNKIINLFEANDKINISDARDCTGLSRKYIIPLLNRIERDGLIKRIGDFRIKA